MNSTKWFRSFIWTGFVVFFVIVLVRFGMSLGNGSSGNNNSVGLFAPDAVAAELKDGKQVIQLGWSPTEGNYAPNIIRLKKNIPAEIVVDTNAVRGCMTTILSPGLGMRGTARTGNNVIRFTPRQTGRFAFSCPMGMGTGEFIVE